jgi:hypothetical protein
MRPTLLLACAGLLATACFGKFALGVTQTIEPTPILPGTSVRQELSVEADGLLGSAAKQAMTDAAAKGQFSGGGTQWQLRDTSEGSATHLRMFRTVSVNEAQSSVPQSSTGGIDVGAVTIRADDWLLVRHYAVRVLVTPNRSTPSTSGTTSSTNDAVTQQVAQAMLAGITYNYYLGMPGFVTATNGLPAAESRLVWHLEITSTAPRTLTAESIYPDWPRILLGLVVVGGVAVLLYVRSRAGRPVAPQPPEAPPLA